MIYLIYFESINDVIPTASLKILSSSFYFHEVCRLSMDTNRNQRVCLDGDMSDMTAVRSGVPQGTVLGPLCFLLYINDIGDSTSSVLRLFADDSLLYRTITDPAACTQLQKDLTTLVEWSKRWQMTFHPAKCYILRVTRKRGLWSKRTHAKTYPTKTYPILVKTYPLFWSKRTHSTKTYPNFWSKRTQNIFLDIR